MHYGSLQYRLATLDRGSAELLGDRRPVDERGDSGDAAVAVLVEDVLGEREPLAVRGEAEELRARGAVEHQPAGDPVVGGDDDAGVVDEVGDRGGVGGEQVPVLAAGQGFAVVGELVV